MHTTHPLASLLRELSTYVSLGASDREAILDLPYGLRRLDAGAFLIREGDQPQHCSLLIEGYAFRQKITGGGSRQILAVCIPGDAVDFQNMFLDLSDHSVQMLTSGRVADISRHALQDLALTHAAVGAGIMQMTAVEASILREWVVNLGRRDARARIAHILCEFAVRLQARGLNAKAGIELPMTQEQLADAAGLTPVHVNRVLKEMERDGLISRRRRQIAFADWRALQEAGDFSRRYLHLEDQDIIAAA